MRKLSSTILCGLLLSTSQIAYAMPSAANVDDLAKQLQQQHQQLELQQERLKQQMEALQQQQQEMAEIRRRVDALDPLRLSDRQLEQLRGVGAAFSLPIATGALTASVPSNTSLQTTNNAQRNAQKKPDGSASEEENQGAPIVVGTERKPDEPERPPEIAANIEEGGVLLPRGRLAITPGLTYTHSSATRVSIEGFSIIPALNIGLFEITELTRDTMNAFVQARYGVTNRFEIEGKIPFLYRQDSTRNRPIGVGSSVDVLNNIDGYGLGDVEVGAHYQINSGKNGWPFFIGNLRFKSRTGTSPFEVATDPATGLATELPTGSGFYAVQPSFTAIYPSDPVVFYSNLGYLYNMPYDYGGTTGEIDPGDSISSGIGFNLALNETSSFSMGYSHSTVFRTSQNGNPIPNTNALQVGSLDLGYSYLMTDGININFNVSAGLTEDAPDVVTTFRIPFSFQLHD